MAENFYERVKASTSSVKNKMVDLKENLWDEEKKEIIEQFKSGSEVKLQEIISSLNTNTSLFSEAGYQLKGITVGLAIPPVIKIGFNCLQSIPENERQKMLDKAGESRITVLMLKSLFKASDFSDTIKIGEIKLSAIEITLGLIPGISITLA
ncbi:MAG: hypothetical protein IPJ03_08040 [Ignavibacteriales bacterium]|nr:hypothetical protein [Ignavibacteriales bacterium]MBK7378947.1 hypothetical protein [Ignavibacteriales bacterium]